MVNYSEGFWVDALDEVNGDSILAIFDLNQAFKVGDTETLRGRFCDGFKSYKIYKTAGAYSGDRKIGPSVLSSWEDS